MWRGAFTVLSTSTTMSSTVTPSATASNDGTSRWLSTSKATSYTSWGSAWARPRMSARALAACTRPMLARGLAPYASSPSIWPKPCSVGRRVASTRRTA